MQSQLDGTFRSSSLKRTIDSEGYVDPETDLWVEGGAAEESFRAWFKHTRDPAIAAQVGADTLTVAVRGRLLEPLQPPATSHSGSEYTVEETGQTLMLIWLPPSLVPEVDKALGRAFIGRLSG